MSSGQLIQKLHDNRAVLAIIGEDRAFREQIASLGGYDVSGMGKIIGVY